MPTVRFKKILIIDDDIWQCDIYNNILENAYEIKTITTLNQAIEVLDTWTPDILLADVLLAGESIFTLLNELQSDVILGKIPVILSTNIGERLNGVRLEEYGVVRVLDKTKLNPNELSRIIEAEL